MTTKNNKKSFESYLNSKKKDKEFLLQFNETKTHLNIAKVIEELRIKKGLTQSQLAQKSDVSQPMIARLEKGDPSRIPTLSTLSKVFTALGYRVDLSIKEAA